MISRSRAIIPTSEWKWFGMAAHLIVGQWCRFHMATQVGEVLVSTVGFYVPPKGSEREEREWLRENEFGEEIGCDRKFETYVFRVSGGLCACGCGMPEIDLSEIDSNSYNTIADANSGHMRMCQKHAVVAQAEVPHG